MELERILSKYEYADVRIERSYESSVRLTNEEVKHASGVSEGIGVRVLKNGSWGFASNNTTRGTEGTINELLKKAEKLANLERGSIKFESPKPEKRKVKERIETIEINEQVKTLLETTKEMKSKNIASRIISCTDSRIIKEFHSSVGTEIIQETGYTYLSCSCIARSGEQIQRGSSRSWSKGGFKRINLDVAIEAKQKALRLLNAASSPKGRFTTVFDPEMTGVFSHEAVGHACEGDSVLDRESILANKIGQRIGNELVSIVDDPNALDFGHYKYDDEGIRAKRTTLVQNGVLKDFMSSMETSYKLKLEPNGHARAQGFEAVPIVRMSNTYFQQGKTSVEDVFEVKNGIYLKGMRGGSVDIFSGGFMFKAEEAYEIKNGEIGKIMRDTTISGNILQTMLDVECVGKDFGTSPGICGKFSQQVPVSDGGPHIRVKNVAIG